MTVDRGSSWMAGQSENSNLPHLPGLGPVPPPNQVGPGGGQPPRPAPVIFLAICQLKDAAIEPLVLVRYISC